MKLSQRKKELIEELEGILKANKDNPHCDEYWLADMIREALKLYDVQSTQAQAEPGLHPQADPRRTQAHAQARAWNTGPGTSLGQAQAFDSNAGPGTGLDTEILMLDFSWKYPIVSYKCKPKPRLRVACEIQA